MMKDGVRMSVSTCGNLGGANNERGIAMLTVLLIMLMMTALGVAALTATGLENRMASFVTSMEGAAAAAESCAGVGINVIQQTIDPYSGAGTLPVAFKSDATPAGPVPQANAALLTQEIMGSSDNNGDFADGTGAVPNLTLTVGAFTVNGDIDRLYIKGSPGSGMQQFGGYEGTGNSIIGSSNIFYRIDCVARNTATGTSARVTAVYACTTHGESCQK
jgi:Tfp pilus assembly protein PilX